MLVDTDDSRAQLTEGVQNALELDKHRGGPSRHRTHDEIPRGYVSGGAGGWLSDG